MYRNSRSNATQTRVSSVTGMPSSGSACTKFPAGSAPCHTASSSTPSTITGEVVGAAAISSRPSAPWRCGGLAPGADHPWARGAAGRAAPRQTQVVRVEYTRRNAILRNSGRLGSWGAADAGAPGRIRTSDPRLRRPLLCPPELRAPALQADQGRLVTQGSMTVDPADERAPVFVRLGSERLVGPNRRQRPPREELPRLVIDCEDAVRETPDDVRPVSAGDLAGLGFLRHGRARGHEGLGSSATESGRPDLNRRPPGPKPGALPACATPRDVGRHDPAATGRNLAARPAADEVPGSSGPDGPAPICPGRGTRGPGG